MPLSLRPIADRCISPISPRLHRVSLNPMSLLVLDHSQSLVVIHWVFLSLHFVINQIEPPFSVPAVPRGNRPFLYWSIFHRYSPSHCGLVHHLEPLLQCHRNPRLLPDAPPYLQPKSLKHSAFDGIQISAVFAVD